MEKRGERGLSRRNRPRRHRRNQNPLKSPPSPPLDDRFPEYQIQQQDCDQHRGEHAPRILLAVGHDLPAPGPEWRPEQ
jgi:hypothetical protein